MRRRILRRYLAKEERYKASGIYLGQSLLAMLSQNLGDRQANPQTDMDFWADAGRSVYRPRYTIEKLKACPNFTHLTGRLAQRFRPGQDGVTLECRNLESGAGEAITARKLLLAAGAINSGRLALASFGDYQSRLPILCNPNHWVAAVNLSMLGKPARDRRHSLSQLTVLMRAESDGPDYVLAQIYSYRSLLLFRLLKDIPLPPRQGLLFLRLLATAFTCVNIHFPDRPSADRWIQLEARDSGDVLRASTSYSAEETAWIQRHEGRMLRFLAGLRCIPMGVNRPLHGASIHYAGTLPYSVEERPYTTAPDGRLRQAPNVYVADGASWRFMPAKGLTLTLMANARRVAAQALRDLAAEDVSSTMSSGEQTVLITGATGFLGRAACAAFTAAGFQVRALVRNPAAAADLQPIAQGGIFRCDLPDAHRRTRPGGRRARADPLRLRDALGDRGAGAAHQRDGDRSAGPPGPQERRPAARVCLFHGRT